MSRPGPHTVAVELVNLCPHDITLFVGDRAVVIESEGPRGASSAAPSPAPRPSAV